MGCGRRDKNKVPPKLYRTEMEYDNIGFRTTLTVTWADPCSINILLNVIYLVTPYILEFSFKIRKHESSGSFQAQIAALMPSIKQAVTVHCSACISLCLYGCSECYGWCLVYFVPCSQAVSLTTILMYFLICNAK